MPYPPKFIRTAAGTPAADYESADDLRHRPSSPGSKTRDSLFWQLTMPDQGLGFQAYLYVTSAGVAGYNVVVWGAPHDSLVLDAVQTTVHASADLQDFSIGGLHLTQPKLRSSAVLRYQSDKLKLNYEFTALHDAFSYRQNPDGLPSWFALNRYEQTGWVKGYVEIGDRRIEWDRIGHRDHSWGSRNWGVPQHWKWIIAYTPNGSRIVNAWIWIAKGEWGFGGYVIRDGELVSISHVKHHADYDADMSQRHLEAEIVDVRGATTHLTLERFAIFKLPSSGKIPTTILEAACTAMIDGRTGAGQFETHWPTAYLEHLAATNSRL